MLPTRMFENCSQLDTINVSGASMIPNGIFKSTAVKKISTIEPGDHVCYIHPNNGTIKFSSDSFSSNLQLTDIEVDNIFLVPGNFSDCVNLTNISLSRCVIDYDDSIGLTFKNCDNIKNIYINNGNDIADLYQIPLIDVTNLTVIANNVWSVDIGNTNNVDNLMLDLQADIIYNENGIDQYNININDINVENAFLKTTGSIYLDALCHTSSATLIANSIHPANIKNEYTKYLNIHGELNDDTIKNFTNIETIVTDSIDIKDKLSCNYTDCVEMMVINNSDENVTVLTTSALLNRKLNPQIFDSTLQHVTDIQSYALSSDSNINAQNMYEIANISAYAFSGATFTDYILNASNLQYVEDYSFKDCCYNEQSILNYSSDSMMSVNVSTFYIGEYDINFQQFNAVYCGAETSNLELNCNFTRANEYNISGYTNVSILNYTLPVYTCGNNTSYLYIISPEMEEKINLDVNVNGQIKNVNINGYEDVVINPYTTGTVYNCNNTNNTLVIDPNNSKFTYKYENFVGMTNITLSYIDIDDFTINYVIDPNDTLFSRNIQSKNVNLHAKTPDTTFNNSNLSVNASTIVMNLGANSSYNTEIYLQDFKTLTINGVSEGEELPYVGGLFKLSNAIIYNFDQREIITDMIPSDDWFHLPEWYSVSLIIDTDTLEEHYVIKRNWNQNY
jgi:hypothetical protein